MKERVAPFAPKTYEKHKIPRHFIWCWNCYYQRKSAIACVDSVQEKWKPSRKTMFWLIIMPNVRNKTVL